MIIKNKGSFLVKVTREKFISVYDNCKSFEETYKNTENEIQNFFDYYYASFLREVGARL